MNSNKIAIYLANIKGLSMKKIIFPLLLLTIIIISYFSIGILVIQPLGALPNGATIVYFRYNTNLNFIESPDSIVLNKGMRLSILTRAIALSKLAPIITEEKIAILPYFEFLYLLSTNNQKFDK